MLLGGGKLICEIPNSDFNLEIRNLTVECAPSCHDLVPSHYVRRQN